MDVWNWDASYTLIEQPQKYFLHSPRAHGYLAVASEGMSSHIFTQC